MLKSYSYCFFFLIATDEGVDYTVYTGVNKLLSGF